jgi:hypothetical protein
MSVNRYVFARCALVLGLLVASVGSHGMAHAGPCNPASSEPHGFVLGHYPSSTDTGITVCARPSDLRCVSCGYATGNGNSNCDNADCTTATCVCGGPLPVHDRIFWDDFFSYQ